jgi:CBS domain containing-hemolysin-like protein
MDVALPTGPGLLLVAALLLLNGLFVAAEFSYVTVRRSQVQRAASDGSRSARRMLGALNNLDYYVAASRLGITATSLAVGWACQPVIADLFAMPVAAVGAPSGTATVIGFALAFLAITAVQMIAGELN